MNKKVLKYFGDNTYRAELWYRTHNPQLGGISPNEMIRLGREDKLNKWIDNQTNMNEYTNSEYDNLVFLIENVNSHGTDILDEIDLCILKFNPTECRSYNIFIQLNIDTKYYPEQIGDLTIAHSKEYSKLKFTRDRSVLKSIRPEDWHLSYLGWRGQWKCSFTKTNGTITITALASTEELAEALAIIKVKQWIYEND